MRQFLERQKWLRHAATVGVVAIVGIVGFQILNATRAAVPFYAVEPENGSLVGTTTGVTDSTASGGKGVKFGASVNTGGFVHPGIMVNKAQLDFVKAKVAAGQQPWKGEYDKMTGNFYGSLSRVATPVSDLKCSTDDNKAASYGYQQVGCEAIVNDSLSAYTQALRWYYSGDPVYAANARKLVTDWGNTLTHISTLELKYPDGTYVYPDGMLYGGWGGTNFIRAAEILRYTYGGWSAADSTLMENNFKNVYYPVMKDAWTGGQNRTTMMNETAMFIGIFTNDRAIYDYTLPQARHSIKSLVYISADGAQPAYPLHKGLPTYVDTPAELKSVWTNPTSYIDGLEQESCRDMGHALMGMGSLANMAETARIQGLDLYGEQQARFVAAYELNAGYVHEYLDQVGGVFNRTAPAGWKPTNFPCNSFAPTAGGNAGVGWELVYNQFKNRRGVAMPKTEQLVNRIRAMPTAGYRLANHMSWEILTHAGTP